MIDDKFIRKFQYFIIGVFCIFIVLLIMHNGKLKSRFNALKNIPKKSVSIVFEENLEKRFLFKKFPIESSITSFKFHKKYPMEFVQYNLFMIFDFTTCGNCQHNQLAILKQHKTKFEEKNIRILGIVGSNGKSDESYLIEFDLSGETFFPCKIIPVEQLYQTFGLNRERFLDTPFYILTSHQYQVLDTCKPKYQDTKEFELWLDIIVNMDVF